LLRPIRMLEGECRRNNVDIRLWQECSPEIIAKEDADVVVMANGAVVRGLPFSPGRIEVFTPEEIMAKGAKPPRRTVVIGGGGVGLGVAVFLLQNGEYDLTVIEGGGRLGRDVNPFYLWQYVRLLKGKRVNLMAGTHVSGISDGGVRVSGPTGEKIVACDGIILAEQEPARPWAAVAGPQVYYIGDALQPRRINNAIHDGYRMGMKI
jgi:hypothetical protein